MSSELRETERHRLMSSSTKSSPPPKRRQLQRAASLESIKKLNSFICSQHYNYILPALLAICKFTSGTAIQAAGTVTATTERLLRSSVRRTFDALYQTASLLRDLYRHLFLLAAVYVSITLVFVQLAACIYHLYVRGHLPAGLLFMIACLYLIAQICHDCLQHFFDDADYKAAQIMYSKSSNNGGGENGNGRQPPGGQLGRKRLSRRDLLGKRTISNLSLF